MLANIPIKTTLPSGTPTEENAFSVSSAAGFVGREVRSTVLEITGTATVGSGSLYLFRYFEGLGWRPWREYHKMTANSAALGGHFSGAYELPLGSTEYFLLYTADAITATAKAQARGY